MNTLLARVPIRVRKEVDGTDLFSLRTRVNFYGFNTIVLSNGKEGDAPQVGMYALTPKKKRLYKFFYHPKKEEQHLFFISEDPDEKKDLHAEKPGLVDQFQEQAQQVYQILQKRQRK